jgi:prepilin-type N-terminal cleavage/methylation domain-containing protein
MKTKTKFRKGFTIVELMVAVMVGTIVVMAAGMVMVMGQTAWNQTWRKVNLQRDASLAMLTMSKYIKSATSATVDPNNKILRINNGSTIFSYSSSTKKLQCQIGGQVRTIVDGKVEHLQFGVVGNNSVTIDLRLKENNAETRFISTVMMRNYGG